MFGNGKFITFEGIDDVEVDRQISLLSAHLRRAGHNVVVTRDPDGTHFGGEISAILGSRSLDCDTAVFLMLAARSEHVRTVINPAILRGDWVLSAGYYHGTAARWSFTASAEPYTTIKNPDLTFFFNVAPKIVADRAIGSDGVCPDHQIKIERISRKYLEQTSTSPSPFVVLDGEKDDAELFTAIVEAVSSLKQACDGPFVKVYDGQKLRAMGANDALSTSSARRLSALANRISAAGGATKPLAVLPWNYVEILDEFDLRFPNFIEFSKFVRNQFILSSVGDGRVWFPPVLLSGEPGVGKTMAVSWLAEKLQVFFQKIDLSVLSSSSALCGNEDTWENATQGAVFDAIALQKSANPFFLLDELDKAERTGYGDPSSALHTLLERKSAKSFQDISLRDFPIDASNISWIATTNDETAVSLPILKRFKVFSIPRPTPKQSEAIIQYIHSNLLDENSWGAFFEPSLDRDVVKSLNLRGVEPRTIGISMLAAFGTAVSSGRNYLIVDDFVFSDDVRAPVGFAPPAPNRSPGIRVGQIAT